MGQEVFSRLAPTPKTRQTSVSRFMAVALGNKRITRGNDAPSGHREFYPFAWALSKKDGHPDGLVGEPTAWPAPFPPLGSEGDSVPDDSHG